MVAFLTYWISYFWLGFCIVWLILGFASKRSVQWQSSGSRILQSGLTVVGLVLIFNFWHFRGRGWLTARAVPGTMPWALAGAALAVAGVLLAFWARASLGRNWSGRVTIKQDHQLILRGPYAFVRHPIYTGLLAGMLGTALIYGRARCFVGLLICALALWLKSQTEEKFMLQQFGEQYAHYRQKVRALVPFVL